MPRKRKKTRTTNAQASGPRKSIDRMKYEIANEFGVNLGASASSRDNGKVGGENTKLLIETSMNKTTTSSNITSSKGNKRKKRRSKKSS